MSILDEGIENCTEGIEALKAELKNLRGGVVDAPDEDLDTADLTTDATSKKPLPEKEPVRTESTSQRSTRRVLTIPEDSISTPVTPNGLDQRGVSVKSTKGTTDLSNIRSQLAEMKIPSLDEIRSRKRQLEPTPDLSPVPEHSASGMKRGRLGQ